MQREQYRGRQLKNWAEPSVGLNTSVNRGEQQNEIMKQLERVNNPVEKPKKPALNWNTCKDGEKLIRYASSVGLSSQLMVRAACACVRTVLKYVPETDKFTLPAIEMLESTRGWCGDSAINSTAEVNRVRYKFRALEHTNYTKKAHFYVMVAVSHLIEDSSAPPRSTFHHRYHPADALAYAKTAVSLAGEDVSGVKQQFADIIRSVIKVEEHPALLLPRPKKS